MAKNKQRNAQKRKQARALKKTRRKTTYNPNVGAKQSLVFSVDFWRAHGCNFIVSNYDEGLWTPWFSEIYQGKKISLEIILERIANKTTDGSDLRNTLLAWVLQRKPQMRVFITYALLTTKSKLPLLMQPYGDLWETMDKLIKSHNVQTALEKGNKDEA